ARPLLGRLVLAARTRQQARRLLRGRVTERLPDDHLGERLDYAKPIPGHLESHVDDLLDFLGRAATVGHGSPLRSVRTIAGGDLTRALTRARPVTNPAGSPGSRASRLPRPAPPRRQRVQPSGPPPSIPRGAPRVVQIPPNRTSLS